MSTFTQTCINYKHDADGIFVVNFIGAISFNDVMKFIAELKQVEGLPNDLFALYNISKASFDLDYEEINAISDGGIDVSNKFNTVKAAYVVDGPKVTAYCMLFSLMNPRKKTEREIFSTIPAAKEWLLRYK